MTIDYEENQACISCIDEEGKCHRRIDVQYHVCQKAFGIGKVMFEDFPSTGVMANSITNPVGLQNLKVIKDMIPMVVSCNETMQ